MSLYDAFLKKIKYKESLNEYPAPVSEPHEYCTRCYATLPLQKGYDPSLPYWVCKGCGQMLINPKVESDIVWFCDGCGANMNFQPGFSEECGVWKCTECGYENKIDVSEIYLSEEEYQAEARNPYRGLSDEDVLSLSLYSDEENVGGRENVIFVKSRESGEYFIKKLLTIYDKSIYSHLQKYPIPHMPRIMELYESKNSLIVIEEYIKGRTLEEILSDSVLSETQVIGIVKKICVILNTLHNMPKPIVHRDIKPSNIIITPEKEVYLLDMNVAKWYDPEKTDDTKYMGTQYFAAPEQVGYGFSSSSAKSDIYAVGMLMNVMLTGCFPKEKRALGDAWKVIEHCISLDAEERYTAAELIEKLCEMEKKVSAV